MNSQHLVRPRGRRMVDEPEPATFVDVLQARGEQNADDELFVFVADDESTDRYTFGRLDASARSVAARLQATLSPGERALLLYPPGPEYLIAIAACLMAGVVAVPAYPPDIQRLSHSVARIVGIVHDSQAGAVLTVEALRASVEQFVAAQAGVNALQVLATDGDQGAAPGDWRRPPGVTRDSVAVLQYTSGSTSVPRGVMLTHANLIANSMAIRDSFGHTRETRGVTWLPPYHDMGLIGGMLQPIFVGFVGLALSPMSFLLRPMRWLRAISDFRANTSGGPSFAYELCLKRSTPEQCEGLDLSCWEVAFNGAEPIRPETLERFAHAFAPYGFRREAFYPCYGLAESTLIVTGGRKLAPLRLLHLDREALAANRVVTATSASQAKSLVGCGKAVRGARVVIVDPAEATRCCDREIGEILVAGTSVASGYWDRPSDTRVTFGARIKGEAESFMRTGDLGFLEDGELYVTGRIKDVIIVRGRNYDPVDIELACEANVPELRPNCGAAFTVATGGGSGQRLAIVYEVSPRVSRPPEDLIRTMRQVVAGSLDVQLDTIALVKPHTVPKTSSGKRQRGECRARLLSGELEVVAYWSLDAASPFTEPRLSIGHQIDTKEEP